MLKQRIIQYFFVIAAVTAILEGAFPPQKATQVIKYALLIISGFVVGSSIKHEQKSILISAGSFILATYLLTKFIIVSKMFIGIVSMMQNFAIFVIIVILILSLEQFANKTTNTNLNVENTKTKVKNEKKIKKTVKKTRKQLNDSEHWWGITILIAVGFTFVILIAEFFFKLSSELTAVFFILDLIITTVFIMDLIILYEKSKTKKEFIKKYFFDIISAIPFAGVFQAVKIVRAVRIIKAMKVSKAIEVSKAMKITKAMKLSESSKALRINQTTKFLSEKSEFNEIVNEQNKKNKKTSSKKKSRKKK